MDFRDLILTNFWRKLFALMLAVLVWVTVHFVEKRQNVAMMRHDTNAPSINE